MRNSRNANVSYFLFLLYPLAALYSAIGNFKIEKSKNIAWLFIIYYGLTFVISDDQLDSRRYANDLSYMYSHEFSDFDGFINLLYSAESNYVDVVQPLLTFFVSRFTDNESILFAVFATVFGFFYTRNIWFLLSFVEGRLKPHAILFLVMSALAIAFWQINGFRFWTAAHVFIYGFFTYSLGKKRKGFLLSLASVLVHFSFLLPVILVVVYGFLGNRTFVLFGVYFLSFFISQVTPQAFSGFSNYLPSVFQIRTARYTSEAYLERLEKEKTKQVNWYVSGRITSIQYAVNALLLFVFLRYRRLLKGKQVELTLLCFCLALGSVYNVFTEVPSMIRFLFIFFVLIFSFFFLLTQRSVEVKWPWWLYSPVSLAILLFVVVEIRIGFNTIGVLTVLGNPLALPFIESDVPLINLVR